jgi:hypothetical protein
MTCPYRSDQLATLNVEVAVVPFAQMAPHGGASQMNPMADAAI